jgi:hypothetical protein
VAGRDRPNLISSPTGASAPVGLDRARQLAWHDVQRTDINQKVEAAADPTHSNWIHKLDIGNTPRILRGRVVDSIAYTNCHKVQFGIVGTMWCSAIMPTAAQPMGARHIGQIPVGANVLVMWFQEDQSGIIVGVLPDAQTSSKYAMADFISQQARSGLLVDCAHHYPICLPNASLITDWSAGRPFDATTQGEQGSITETGLLEFIDSFMTTKRVDEECGIWHFWHDQMTRLAGHNFQLWTAGYEREDLDDEGEFDKVEGHTPYYWEALGAFEFGHNISRDIPTKCWQKDPDLQGYSGTEPCDDHQLPFFRLRDFYGYLGQAHKRVLAVPPQKCRSLNPTMRPLRLDEEGSSCCPETFCELSSCSAGELNTLDKLVVYPGVFEENLALTGRYAVRSAHEIIFSKHLLIPVPKQMRRPEDPNGDNATNYRATGHTKLGNGLEHNVAGEIDQPQNNDDNATQIRAAGFLDTHAFVFNWIAAHPFYYHMGDWFLPNETMLGYLASECGIPSFTPPYFDELKCHQFLDAPPAIPIKVDHRYGEVKYYPNHSYFGLLTDGGIVLGDGFGSEIKMANGNIYFTCPGDTYTLPGRNAVTFAGYDFIMRAHNSFDLSATRHDGRLKAERNLQLAATGHCGGVLIESMAKHAYCTGHKGQDASTGGITFRAKKSLITTYAKDLCFRLAKESSDKNVIIFDAGKKGRIKMKAKFHERFIDSKGAALDFWCSGSKIKRGAEHWRSGTLLCAPLVVTDKILSGKCIVAEEDLVSVKGHVITKKAKKTMGKVGVLKEKKGQGSQDGGGGSGAQGKSKLAEAIKKLKHRCSTLKKIGKTELKTLDKRQKEYSCTKAKFSFRLLKDYRCNDFVMFESRWQQWARLSGAQVAVWKETGVNGTYPYPGKRALSKKKRYKTLDPILYDQTTGLALDRGPLYENPEFNAPKSEVMNKHYIVIM